MTDAKFTPKKVLFFLMPYDYRDEEFEIPYTSIIAAGHHVDVAGLNLESARATNGFKHKPNLLFELLSQEDLQKYDAFVIPGGTGCRQYQWGNEHLIDVIRFFYRQKKLIAAICHACVTLAEAGILTNKKATVYPSDNAKKYYQQYGVEFVDTGCFVLEEDHIITAQGPGNANEFAQQIILNLKK